ncbi:GNAT family N-acetyltransferase [Pseudolysinimonas sp.]|jgi:GNAT superfamily N-acetyltransferase|uniref:GNAT family N-acetyltransferase n=1 Tax=Pseudolysinimonas sp. TaxID=2680009 RepID=UPI0037833938
MTRALDPGIVIRRVRADEGPRVRRLRLEALADPVAAIAFLETTEQALARPDAEWSERAARNATAADQAGFVAVLDDEHVGSVVVFPRRAGEPDYFQRIPTVDTATLVGVYVSPRVRGRGVIDALIRAAQDWARDAGYPELTLDVHERNVVAIAAYRRGGFEVVGEFAGDDGREIAMAAKL